MARTPQARIAYGRIHRVSLDPLTDQSRSDVTDKPQGTALQQALLVGTSHTRYSREWRMGQWRLVGRRIVGRIGFQAAGDVTELWDDKLNDFRAQRLLTGTTAPFAIDTRTLRLTYQVRPGVIERGSFVGALQGLMNEASPMDRWRVVSEFHDVPWEHWVSDVSEAGRITRLEVKLERPNPNYHGREDVEHLIEDVGAHLLRLVYEAPPNDLQGLKIDDDLVMEMIEHAQQHGDWRATAEVTEEGQPPRKVQWRSDQEGVAPERRAEADPLTREARDQDLLAELGEGDDQPTSSRENLDP